MNKYLIRMLVALALVLPIPAFASDGGAQWKTFGPFINSAGSVELGIRVDVYTVGTTTNKTYWTDEAKISAGAHPLVDSDSDGVVGAFFDGDYRFRVKDSAGAVLTPAAIDWDNVKVTSDTATMWEGNCGTSFPSATAANRWQLACTHTSGNILQDIGINDGSNFISLFGNKVFKSESYADCSSAITSIGSTIATLLVTTDCAISSTATAPSTLTWQFEGQGQISPATTKVLTIAGPFIAPPRQVINCVSLEKCVILTDSPMSEAYVEWFGGKGDNSTLNQIPLNALIGAFANGQKLKFQPGIYLTAGEHDFPQDSSGFTIIGSGMSSTTIEHTATSGNLFKLSNTSDVTVNLAGIRFQNLTLKGSGKTDTGKAVLITNRVNIVFDFVQINDFEYGIETADNANTSSVNDLNILNSRIFNNKFGVFLRRGCNACRVQNVQFQTDSWSLVVYNANNFSVSHSSFNGLWTTAGSGAIWLGGLDTFSAEDLYFEGNPLNGSFFVVANLETDGTTATNTTIGGRVVSNGFISSSGTNYGIRLKNVADVSIGQSHAGSGISTALIRAETGVKRIVVINNAANPGLIVSYQTASDADKVFDLGFKGDISAVLNKLLLGSVAPDNITYQLFINGALGLSNGSANQLVARNAAGTGVVPLIRSNSSDQVELDAGGGTVLAGSNSVSLTFPTGEVKNSEVVTGSLPAAGASQDGKIIIELGGNIIVYSNGDRIRITGTSF